MSEKEGVPGATQSRARLATARAVPARPFSLWLSRAAKGAAPPGLLLADARLAGDRRAAAQRGAGALSDRRTEMEEAARGEFEREERALPASSGAGAPTRPEVDAAAPPGDPPAVVAGQHPQGPQVGAARVPASLSAAERLEVELLRRERAAGPELRLALGSALEVRLAQAAGGVELAIAGPRAPSSETAWAELPSLLRALAERGVRVARAEVRPAPADESPSASSSPPALAR